MVGEVVVKPTGASVPSDAQDAAALTQQVKSDLKVAKKLATTRVPAGQVSVGVSGASGVELFNMYPGQAEGQARDGREVLHVGRYPRDPHGNVRTEEGAEDIGGRLHVTELPGAGRLPEQSDPADPALADVTR